MNISDIFRKFLSYVYPDRCIFCDTVVKYGNNICVRCKNYLDKSTVSRKLYIDDHSYVMCASSFSYNNRTKSALFRFKFDGKTIFAKFLSVIMYNSILKCFNGTEFKYISYVPMYESKLKERGYNQSQILAEQLSKNMRIDCIPILIKKKDNLIQHNLAFKDRIDNVKGVYSINNSILDNIDKNKNLILIDDIITTGSTLKECVKILKKNGFKKIYCATLAHV